MDAGSCPIWEDIVIGVWVMIAVSVRVFTLVIIPVSATKYIQWYTRSKDDLYTDKSVNTYVIQGGSLGPLRVFISLWYGLWNVYRNAKSFCGWSFSVGFGFPYPSFHSTLASQLTCRPRPEAIAISYNTNYTGALQVTVIAGVFPHNNIIMWLFWKIDG